MTQTSTSPLHQMLRLWGWMMFVATLSVAWHTPARAQDGLPSPQELLDESAKRIESQRLQPIEATTVKALNVRVHWKLWKRVISEGKTGKNELRALHDDLASIGVRNHPSYVLASIAWVEQQHKEKAISGKAAAEALDYVSLIGPDMPHPYLAHVKMLVRSSPSKVGVISGQTVRGFKRLWYWPGMAHNIRYNLMSFVLLSMLLAGSFFLLGQLVRYFGIISHDASRLMPKGFSTNQTLLVILGILLVPGLVLQSPLLSVFILLLMLSAVQQPNERIATGLIFITLLALPQLQTRLSHEATFQDSPSKQLFIAQYMDCDEACREKVDQIAKATEKPDRILTYTQMYQLYRQGKAAEITKNPEWTPEKIKRWSKNVRGHALNLYGAALIAQVQSKDAIASLTEATKLLKKTPAPHINLMRIYQIDKKKDEALKHLDLANKRDLLATVSFLKYQKRDINSYLWVEPLKLELFYKRHVYIDKPKTLPIIERVWPYLAGKTLPLSAATILGIIGLAVLLLTLPLSLKGQMSTPCPKCGLARDPEDGAKTADHKYCALCYNTFIAGAQYNFQNRVNNEERINARNANMRITKRLLSAVAPGTGHAIAGYGLVGLLVSFLLFFGLFFFMIPSGLWQPPQNLLHDDWIGIKYAAAAMLGVAILAGIYGAANEIDPIDPITKKHGRPVQDEEGQP